MARLRAALRHAVQDGYEPHIAVARAGMSSLPA
jgi:hypothetical protein